MITLENRTGRLYEIRFTPPFSVDETDRFLASLGRRLVTVGQPGRFGVDAQAISLLPSDVADRLLRLMKNDNALVERTAFLIKADPLAGLQIERMLREAGSASANRRLFRDRAPLAAWLGEGLTAAERQRLERFLDEGPPP